jgi:hypothetical protein
VAALFYAHHSPPGIASCPRQSSIEPGASFQFGRTSTRPQLLHFTLALNRGTGVSPGLLDTSMSP